MSPKNNRNKKELPAFDDTGRPVVHEHRKPFLDLTGNCCKVLYALALTELRGNRNGLSKHSIRMILQHEDDVMAGTWQWLRENTGRNGDWLRESGPLGVPAIKNAVEKLRWNYPIIVIKTDPKLYYPMGSVDRSEGGRTPNIFVLNPGSCVRWPCGAQVMKVLNSEILHCNPLRYSHLLRHMKAENHASHMVPSPLLKIAPDPDEHSLRDDIEFLVRTRYIRLFTHEEGDPRRQEIPHSIGMKFADNAIIELDERAAWERVYFEKLSEYFGDPSDVASKKHSERRDAVAVTVQSHMEPPRELTKLEAPHVEIILAAWKKCRAADRKNLNPLDEEITFDKIELAEALNGTDQRKTTEQVVTILREIDAYQSKSGWVLLDIEPANSWTEDDFLVSLAINRAITYPETAHFILYVHGRLSTSQAIKDAKARYRKTFSASLEWSLAAGYLNPHRVSTIQYDTTPRVDAEKLYLKAIAKFYDSKMEQKGSTTRGSRAPTRK